MCPCLCSSLRGEVALVHGLGVFPRCGGTGNDAAVTTLSTWIWGNSDDFHYYRFYSVTYVKFILVRMLPVLWESSPKGIVYTVFSYLCFHHKLKSVSFFFESQWWITGSPEALHIVTMIQSLKSDKCYRASRVETSPMACTSLMRVLALTGSYRATLPVTVPFSLNGRIKTKYTSGV